MAKSRSLIPLFNHPKKKIIRKIIIPAQIHLKECALLLLKNGATPGWQTYVPAKENQTDLLFFTKTWLSTDIIYELSV